MSDVLRDRLHARLGFSNLGLLLLAIAIGWSFVTPFVPLTRAGIQCPTAPIQKIQVPVRCCGKVIGFQVRAPKPGEFGFVQCRCEEKRAPVKATATASKFQVFVPVGSGELARVERLASLPALDTTGPTPLLTSIRSFFHPPDVV